MAANHTNVVTIAGSTPITTSAYVELVSALPIPISKMVIANSTDTDIRLAYGADGDEIDYVAVGTGETLIVPIGLNIILVGTRLAVEAIGADSTQGNFTVSFLP